MQLLSAFLQCGVINLFLHIGDCQGLNRHLYNTPESFYDVAVVMATTDHKEPRDIILTTQQGKFEHINELNPSYDCLAYCLFGKNLGFQLNIPHISDSQNVTICEFYA